MSTKQFKGITTQELISALKYWKDADLALPIQFPNGAMIEPDKSDKISAEIKRRNRAAFKRALAKDLMLMPY